VYGVTREWDREEEDWLLIYANFLDVDELALQLGRGPKEVSHHIAYLHRVRASPPANNLEKREGRCNDRWNAEEDAQITAPCRPDDKTLSNRLSRTVDAIRQRRVFLKAKHSQ